MPTGKYPRKDPFALLHEAPKVTYPLSVEEVLGKWHGSSEFECHLPSGVTWQSLAEHKPFEYLPREVLHDRYSFKTSLSGIDYSELNKNHKTALMKRREGKLKAVSDDALLAECKRRGLKFSIGEC